jgi:hypothetical protein
MQRRLCFSLRPTVSSVRLLVPVGLVFVATGGLKGVVSKEQVAAETAGTARVAPRQR